LLTSGLALIYLSISRLGFPGVLSLSPILLSTYQFSITPLFRLLGIYRYHSPMLKATIRTSRVYEIHGGTNFDYVLNFGWADRGPVAARKVLIFYLEGLRDIADLVSRGELPRSIQIAGTSYFFRDESARRLGFSISKPGLRLRLNLFANLFDLFLMHSFTRGRLCFPRILRVRQASIRGDRLVAHRGDVERMILSLRRPAPGSRGGIETDHRAICA